MEEKFEYKEWYQYLTSAMLNVTDDCNLACRYCFVEQHPHYMPLETAKAAADWLYNNHLKKVELGIEKEEQLCSLCFFGGEPTLCYDSVIVPVVKYIKEKYPNKFMFGITTNGTLLSQERINFFKENNFSMLLSIDGAEETQCFNRPCRDPHLNSFKLIEKNIPALLEAYPNITFRSTIYAPTVEHLFENYLYAESLGFKSFVAIEDCRHGWTQEQLNQLDEEFQKIYCYRLEQIIKGTEPIKMSRFNGWLRYTTSILENKFNFYNGSSVMRCGLATTNGAIAYDGSIYGCQEQPSKDKKNIFLVGNIFDGGINIERHKQLLEFYYQNNILKIEQKEECKNCKLNNLCQMNFYVCPSSVYDLSKTMSYIPEVTCRIHQNYLKNSILFLNILLNLENENINNYIRKCIQEGDEL